MPAALLFPGQGSQFAGMARDVFEALPAAREVICQADELLGYRLSELMFEGPAETLTQTVHAQPAIFTASVALLRCVRPPAGIAFAAGHSVGEYAALAAAGALSFEEALSLVKRRGELMHEAGAERPGGMLAVLGLDELEVEEVCASVAPLVVVAANFNAPGQMIVSGEKQGLTAVAEALKERGARRILPLHVSAAFHSPLMAPAAAKLRQALEVADIRLPLWPIVGNVSGRALDTVDGIRQELCSQIEAPVRWTETIRTIVAAGVDRLVEIGPGKVLTGLARRVAPNVEAVSVSDLSSAQSLSW